MLSNIEVLNEYISENPLSMINCLLIDELLSEIVNLAQGKVSDSWLREFEVNQDPFMGEVFDIITELGFRLDFRIVDPKTEQEVVLLKGHSDELEPLYSQAVKQMKDEDDV